MINFKPLADAVIFLAITCLVLLVALIGCIIWIATH